jgi:alpha-ribazole phosphatase
MSNIIHLIRHGVTEGTRDRLLYGKSDIPLLPEGADALKALAAEGVYPAPEGCEFFSSGMRRANQSLDVIYGEIEREHIEELREFDCGVFEMRSYKELAQLDEYKRWAADVGGSVPPPGGESFAVFRLRVKAGAERLLAPYRAGSASADSIVVCHGGVIAMMMDGFFPGLHEHPFKWVPNPGHGYSVTIRDGTDERYVGF